MERRPFRAAVGTLATTATFLISGCSLPAAEQAVTRPASADVPVLSDASLGAVGADYAVAAPGRLDRPLLTAHVLVVGEEPLGDRVVDRVRDLRGVRSALPLSLASVPVAGRTVTVGAVDPASYRRFTPERSARSTAVWRRVASGELALRPDLARAMRQPLGGDIVLGNQDGALEMRVGAFASLSPGLDAVVNHRRGEQLGMVDGNGLLVSARTGRAATLVERIERMLPRRASVHSLAGAATSGEQTAFLTGGSVAEAVGSFSYRYFEDGTLAPDPAWVAAHIRTETVPILGRVTCHRVMLPQLRGALQEVVAAGLASAIDPSDYGGCYVPRFIAYEPSNGLSLHSWGIAVDLNVQGNLRGTVGEIDRRVVEIFKRWGFAWGGDWAYTDPMHFELAALVRPAG